MKYLNYFTIEIQNFAEILYNNLTEKKTCLDDFLMDIKIIMNKLSYY